MPLHLGLGQHHQQEIKPAVQMFPRNPPIPRQLRLTSMQYPRTTPKHLKKLNMDLTLPSTSQSSAHFLVSPKAKKPFHSPTFVMSPKLWTKTERPRRSNYQLEQALANPLSQNRSKCRLVVLVFSPGFCVESLTIPSTRPACTTP